VTENKVIAASEAYADAVRFSFGDTPELADQLLSLVLEGKKTATCGALRDFVEGGETLPQVGRQDIVLDGRGRPAAVIETTDVQIRRFHDVDAAFAFDEGEGDRSLESWRREHEGYFRRNGGFTPEMELVCERFRLVERLNRDQG
jgi:uncharacterized protein YhfF